MPNALELDAENLYWFGLGEHEGAWRLLGAHSTEEGLRFSVWAPQATAVSVVGDFNHWDSGAHPMTPVGESGIWQIVVPGVTPGQHYKYAVRDAKGHMLPFKSDPYARETQLRPHTASMVAHEAKHVWQDAQWLRDRSQRQLHREPLLIYELHAGSWRRDKQGHFLNYRDLADTLIPYLQWLGFTHLQLMPLAEYPFDASWGYQPLGLFSPTRRFGSPDDLRYLVDRAHAAGLGVLLDWVPAHFPADAHGLARFDGSALYEHADPRQGYHPQWETLVYNYGRAEVISLLLSNALYWLEEFHFDGLRVDAVASMLYLDYSRGEGQWLPNQYGGVENLEAVALLRLINERVHARLPGITMIAEESTSWPGVTQMTSQGGLGFGFKWNMGWMNDTLTYMARDPLYRSHHHHEMTFGLLYAFSEQFILPLSHDEVVYGKRSLLSKMPGDSWQQFANLRAYYGFMWAHPGKKLLFMGSEFGQRNEWQHDQSLDWHLLDGEGEEATRHRGVQSLLRDLNHCLRQHPALFANDADSNGFSWIDADASAHSVFAFSRQYLDQLIIIVVNLTPEVHTNWQLGVPRAGSYRELLNTDSHFYGGSGVGNDGLVQSEALPSHGHDQSLCLRLPPLGAIWLCHQH